jgi:hypothetical protein
VGRAFKYLKDTFQKHFHEAMLDVGHYIINEFFNGDYELARNPRNAIKIHSLNQLIKRLQENSGHAPSKTWVYDAVKLAIDENNFKDFRTYGKIGHSHKVLLTHVPDIDLKKKLVDEVVNKGYPVVKLRERIKEEKNGHKLKFDHILVREDLEYLEMDELEGLRELVSKKIAKYRDQLHLHEESLKIIKSVIADISIGLNESDPVGIQEVLGN